MSNLPTYPTNKDEYWLLVDANWDKLYDILVKFLPKEQLSQADNLRLNHDPKLSRLLNDAWFNAPDSSSIHYIPGWHTLCDLCSESHVLGEDNDE